MASNRQSPLWNQDAIMAAGLAFAGMAVLQSTLLPAGAGIETLRVAASGVLNRLFDWHAPEWWPVLLIAAGVGLWLRDAYQKHSMRNVDPELKAGGTK